MKTDVAYLSIKMGVISIIQKLGVLFSNDRFSVFLFNFCFVLYLIGIWDTFHCYYQLLLNYWLFNYYYKEFTFFFPLSVYPNILLNLFPLISYEIFPTIFQPSI